MSFLPTVFEQVAFHCQILFDSPVLLHSQKKPQKVSLLFEDEDDDLNRGLFGAKSTTSVSSAAPQASVSSRSF